MKKQSDAAKLRRLRTKLKIAKEALKYYADDDTWGSGQPAWMRLPIHKDRGRLAQAALKELEDGK